MAGPKSLSRTISVISAVLHVPVVWVYADSGGQLVALLWLMLGVLWTIELWMGESLWAKRIVSRSFNTTKVIAGLYTIGLLGWAYLWVWRTM